MAVRPCPECGCYGVHHPLCPEGTDEDSAAVAREIRKENAERKALRDKELGKAKDRVDGGTESE